ncbi:hypothetical protein [Zhenpiania hominis]|uniref:Peptidase M28 domain-containing protein n=1 Tax=Zhenpiania hominis TaxID=2763644 RepID=A0A923NJK9_9FIRM|nr:hypothetical protein [Zhenpiania hominis]MBC6680268.1 hypothetical protein [Zhenpiania hominis]
MIRMIEGTGNTGQQILLAGHYDKYFYGFQDDSLAVAIVSGVAKVMKDSGYPIMKGWTKIYNTTHSIANPCGDNYHGKADSKYTEAIAAYNAEVERLNPILKQQIERETAALEIMTEMMK